MKVLVVAGSSGGHIFPAQALMEYLRDNCRPIDILLVLPARNVKKADPAWAGRTAYIDAVSLEARIDSRNLLGVFQFFKASWQSLIIVLRFKPEVVVGFGSIASIPTVIFCWLGRLKVVLHEQNVIPGRANRFLSRFCDRIAVSFPQSRGYLKASENKIVLTGNPLRRNLVRLDKVKCREYFALEESKFTILVMGGSQGSSNINRGLLYALSNLVKRDNLQVIHLAGPGNEEGLKRQYSDLGVKARIFPFLNEMEYALSLADLAVCRAGATSIQELIRYKLPAVLLPYPFAYQHQMANAKVLEAEGAAIILEDKELDSDKLGKILEKLSADPLALGNMRQGYGSFRAGDAAKNLAELVMDKNITHG
jgi:UDP-N-acetylglucosamine--N-acetylmuramyl-(pentapeptide) pyrophosphoryl-undecaprenol N-acetylglucosamine transferase